FSEEDDLNLALDKSPTPFTNSTKKAPYLKKTCFRRTFSLNLTSYNQSQALTVSHNNHHHSSQSPITPTFLTNTILIRDSRSRPVSSQAQSHHISPSTLNNINSDTQYYQDPDACLKLQHYLASPYNFNEAIELGFPAQENRDITSDQQSSPNPSFKSQKITKKPLKVSQGTEISTSTRNISGLVQPSCILEHSVPCNNPTLNNSQQTCTVSLKTNIHPNLKRRELTLKMILTRPDLRANSWNTISHVIDIPQAIKATKPPSAERDFQIQDSDNKRQGKINNLWCKLQI
ncbi:uncharacterized protein BO80DRAFT_473752, partial [Aspergillus ibericus CBS 121593]